MNKLAKHQEIVKNIINHYAQFKASVGEIENVVIFDEERHHYQLMYVGWLGFSRMHGMVLHIDLIGDKVWIQHDGIGVEGGIAEELVKAGISRQEIVLGFHPPSERHYTEYAVG